jgi:hypothetical protein
MLVVLLAGQFMALLDRTTICAKNVICNNRGRSSDALRPLAWVRERVTPPTADDAAGSA